MNLPQWVDLGVDLVQANFEVVPAQVDSVQAESVQAGSAQAEWACQWAGLVRVELVQAGSVQAESAAPVVWRKRGPLV
jgi:hypothetical protein